MNAKDLQELVVLRNHAQNILNGARADLKLSKEDKSSLMNGLKKVDDLFIKNFERCVDSLNVVTKSRNWTSTESEEDVLAKALKQDDCLVKAALKGALEERSGNALARAAAVAAASAAIEADDPIVINSVDTGNSSLGAVVSRSGSEVKTLPVVSLPSEPAKKVKKSGFKRA